MSPEQNAPQAERELTEILTFVTSAFTSSKTKFETKFAMGCVIACAPALTLAEIVATPSTSVCAAAPAAQPAGDAHSVVSVDSGVAAAESRPIAVNPEQAYVVRMLPLLFAAADLSADAGLMAMGAAETQVRLSAAWL